MGDSTGAAEQGFALTAARDGLTEEQVRGARRLWAWGMPLGQIGDLVGCTIPDLSPWLYAEAIGRRTAGRERSTVVQRTGVDDAEPTTS